MKSSLSKILSCEAASKINVGPLKNEDAFKIIQQTQSIQIHQSLRVI